MVTDASYVAAFSLLIAGLATYFFRKKPLRPSLPPGPPGLPVLGNVLEISTTEPWASFMRFGETYGDIVRVRILTQDAIILNSYEVIRDLLEQRSHNYSNRPYAPGTDIMDSSWNTGTLPYGEEWRIHRKMFHQAIRPETVSSYYGMLSSKARELLENINDSPTNFKQHLGRFSIAVAMAATYDYHPAAQSDPMVENIRELDDTLSSIFSPGLSAILLAFPILLYVPAWFPGATWRRTAQQGRRLLDWWFTTPIQYVKDKIAAGSIAPCIVGDALTRLDEKQVDAAFMMQIAKGVGATSLFAASETTNSTLQVFLLAMVLYPEVQKRARDEILAVVGTGRLPDLVDRPNLPYIDAIMRETLRWHPVLPFSVGRTSLNDDVYRGYRIPKGVMILPNVWGITHNEAKYPDPFTFNPSRFFDNEGKLNNDTMPYAFGFGRRICAGMHLANSSLWLAIASLLSAFSFEPPLDETGHPVKIEPTFTAGLTSHPDPLPVRIILRMGAEQFTSLLRMDDDV